ncbi:hypothetical protein N9M66_04035 [Litoreibacter sp.]|nr:hypothetical protein [Litoreibacter sp.]
MKYIVVLTTLIAASSAQAGQPISVSMAECAGITLAISHHVHTPHRKERILSISDAWADAADDEAGRDMSAVVIEKADMWREKGRMVAFTEEFKDWTDYCGSLARHKGLKLVPES